MIHRGGFRRRLVATLVAIVGLTAALLAAVAYAVVSISLHDQLVRTSIDQAQFNVAVLADERLSDHPTATELAQSGLVEAFQLRGDAQTLVDFGNDDPFVSGLAFRSAPSLFSEDLKQLVRDGHVGFQWLTVDGQPYLAVGARRLPDGPDFYFFFPTGPLDDALARLAQALAAGLLTALVLALIAAGAIARGVLRPVREASVAAGRIERGDLTARVPGGAPDEFGRWAAAFNRMAASLERTVEQLREAQAQQRRFVADVSHELRTPITALVNEATLIAERSSPDDPDGRRLGVLLVRDVARLRTLVDDLLEVSRLDAAVDPIASDPVDLGRFVRALVAARLPDATVTVEGEHGIVSDDTGTSVTGTSVTGTSVTGGIVIRTDRRRLERIVGNLLDNAREHASGRAVEVDVAREWDMVRLSVADRGPGVDPLHLPRLFERFYKADPSRVGGTSGLGLAIANEHAERLGGSLVAHLRPRGGLVVMLRLPLLLPPVTRSLHDGDLGVTNAEEPASRAAALPPP